MYGRKIIELNTKEILRRTSEYDIFRYYIPGFTTVNKPFCSELRGDKNPSASIGPVGIKLWYRDFATNEGYNCFDYVKVRFNLDFYQALSLINIDFRLGLGEDTRINPKPVRTNIEVVKKIVTNTEISIRIKEWGEEDLNYWKEYGISFSTLRFYRVFPIVCFWVNGKIAGASTKSKPLYAYRLGRGKYKIYSPFADSYRFITNCRKEDYQGYDQLSWVGELLIITKAMKDVMVLHELGIPAIAPQSEAQVIDPEFMNSLKDRFSTILIWFDNDKPGLDGAEKNCIEHNIKSLIIPTETGYKDPAQFAKHRGLRELEKIIFKI